METNSMMGTGGTAFVVLGPLLFLVLGSALADGLGYLFVKRLGSY